MAILDDDLRGKASVEETSYKEIDPVLGSPKPREVDVTLRTASMGGFETYAKPSKGGNGMTIDQLSTFAKLPQSQSTFNSPAQMIPRSELLANQRYPLYNRNIDLENVYGLQQSWYDRLANGIIKAGGLATGTFLQGFATTPNTIAAIKNGKLSDLSGGVDGYESAIDTWTRNLEDVFPNYRSRKEQENPLLGVIPFFPGSANFWGDMIIKNLGFMAGAVANAAVQDAAIGFVTGGVGEAPLIASQIGKAALWMNKIMAGTNKVDDVLNLATKVGASKKLFNSVENIGAAAQTVRLADGFRYGMALYGASRTEAAVEARDSYKTIREELVNQHKLYNDGQEPTGKEAQEIENYAIAGMNTRFGVNMALLLASNSILLGNVFKSFTKTSKGLTGQITKELEDLGKIGLKEKSIDEFERKTAKTISGKIWESVRPKIPNILSEGVYEEGGQFATEKGVYDYYTRKYKSPDKRESWNTTEEIVKSTLEGLSEQFGSSEGQQGMIVGAITAMLVGAVQGKVDAAKGRGSEARLQSAINILNQHGLTGTLSNQFQTTANSVQIAKEMDEAAKSGNIFKYNNLKNDAFFEFVNSRLPIDMHDVTIEQLKLLKELDKEEFERTFGMDFGSSNKNTVNEYVDALVLQANRIKKTYDSVNSTFTNPFKKYTNPQTDEEADETIKSARFDHWKKELVRVSNIVPEMEDRVSSIEQTLTSISPKVSTDVLARITEISSLKQLAQEYEQKAVDLSKTVTDATPINVARETRAKARMLRTMSEKINLAINNKNYDDKLFYELLNFEVNNQDEKAPNVVGPEKTAELFTFGVDINAANNIKKAAVKIFENLSSEKGFNKFFNQEDQVASPKEEVPVEAPEGVFQYENKQGVKEPIELEREYEIPPFNKATIKKLADDRYEVTTPDGNKTFYSSKEDADIAADEFNEQFKGLEKLKVVALNPDGSVKIEDSKGDIYNISIDKLKGYQKIETEQEKLQKLKEDIDLQQKEAENESSTIATSEQPTEIRSFSDPLSDEYKGNPNDKRKFLAWLFWSTTAPSEDNSEDISKPHVARAIHFLNNARKFKKRSDFRIMLVTPKQEEFLGLKGLTKLSTGEDVKTKDGKVVIDNLETDPIFAVYIEEDGPNKYFIDQDGNRIGKVGEQVDMSKVVFNTMPDTSLFWKDGGKNTERYREGEKEQAEAFSRIWLKKREQLFNLPADSPETYSFRISKGIFKISSVTQKNSVSETLVDEKTIKNQEGLIAVSKTGVISHQGINYKIPVGQFRIQYDDLLAPAVNNMFSRQQAEAIYKVLEALSNDVKRQMANKEKIVFNPDYRRFLTHVLYWKKSPQTKKPSQIHIDDKMNLSLGEKKYDLTKVADFKKEIVDQLATAYHNINDKSLSPAVEGAPSKFREPFIEFYIENEKLESRKWSNYQTYLLSSKYPDGKARSVDATPITTYVDVPTPESPNTKQKYAIIEETEAMQLPVIKKEAVTEKPPVTQKPPVTEKEIVKIDGYELNNNVENTYTFKAGNVKFKGNVNPQTNTTSIEIVSNDKETLATIEKIASDSKIVDGLIPSYEKEKKETVDKTDIKKVLEVVTWFLGSRISIELNQKLKEKPAAPVKEETPVSVIPVTIGGVQFIPDDKTVYTSTQVFAEKDGDKKPVQFRLTRNEEGNIVAKVYTEDQTGNALLEKADEPSSLAAMRGFLPKVIKNYIPSAKPITDAALFAAYKVTAVLQQQMEEDKKADIEGKPAEGISDIDDKRKEVRAVIQKAGQGEGGQFFVTLVDGTREGAVRVSLVGNELAVGPKGTLVDLSVIVKVENPDGTILYDVTKPAEAPVPAKEEPVTPVKKKGGKRPSAPEKRAIGDKEEKKGDRITANDIEIFKEYHARVASKLPYEISERIFLMNNGERAWGVLEDGVAKFYRGAIRGTEYHELFEGIWKYFLTEEERTAILEELKNKPGKFTDRASGKKISYDEATDKQLKERIADDFADYRVGKLPARSLSERIVKFFKAIIEFFKSFVSKPSRKEELFKAIDAGRFKDYNVPESSRRDAPEYSQIEGLFQQQTREYVEDMTIRIFEYLFKSNRSLYQISQVTDVELYNVVKTLYQQEERIDDTDPELLSTKQFDELFVRTKEFLRTFKIEFDDENVKSINNEDIDNRSYAPEPFETDWKKQSPYAIKLLLGINVKMLSKDDADYSSIDGFKLVNFGQMFGMTLDKLSNTSSVSKMLRSLYDIAKSNVNYVRVLRRLKISEIDGTVNFSQFEPEDWRLFVQFYQTFAAKQKPVALVQYEKGGKVYTAPANLFTAIKEKKDDWVGNMRVMSKLPDSIIKYNSSTKTYQVADVKDIPISTPEEQVKFLQSIGIDFPLTSYLKLSSRKEPDERQSPKEAFGTFVGRIHKFIGENKDIVSVTGKTLAIDNAIDRLAQLYLSVESPMQETTRFNLEGKRVVEYAENNYSSVFENEFNESATLDELLEKRPELNDVFSKNSVILKKGGLFYNEDGDRIGRMKVYVIEGNKSISSISSGEKATVTARLSPGMRKVAEFNQNLNGRYYVLIPADSSTEWMLSVGNNISFIEVVSGRAWDDVYDIFKGYLLDEFALAKSDRSYLRNTKPRAKELRFFNEILSPELLKESNNLIDKDASNQEIEEFIKQNQTKINESVKAFIETTVQRSKEDLMNASQILPVEENYSFSRLDADFLESTDEKLDKNNLTEKELSDILTFANINYVIANIEMHKVIFGDPYQFKIKDNLLDETKRIKSYLSPRRTTFDTPEINNILNIDRNLVGDIPLMQEDPGHHVYKPYMRTSVFSDVNIVGKLFPATNETDAFSIIKDTAWREVKEKNGQLTEEGEKFFQWHAAYTRVKLAEKGVYTYTNEKLKQQDKAMISKPMPKYMLEILKPIVTGNKEGRNYSDKVLDKFSQMPFFYHMAEQRNLEQLYIKMWKEDIDYIVYESGRKEGIEENTHSVYLPDGQLNNQPFNNSANIPWKAYGIQVETSYDDFKDDLTRGSQPTKMISIDLFSDGEAITKEAKEEYDRNVKFLNEIHRNRYEDLLLKMGLKDLGNAYKIVDRVALSKSLEHEILRRNFSENVVDTVQLDENKQFRIPFESSNAYTQIRTIIFSMINSALVSVKTHGGGYVQVPVTGWESLGSSRSLVKKTFTLNGKEISLAKYNGLEESDKNNTKVSYEKISISGYEALPSDEKKIVYLSDDTLKMPTLEDPFMEVMLPHWFREKLPKKYDTDEKILTYLNSSEGNLLLQGFAFRIPTQASSSMAAIRVKGFLPQYMGYTVVVPSEITTLAGSDFDIDKLFIYLKSFYLDEKGDIRLVRYYNSEQETKDFYTRVYEDTLQKDIEKLEKYEEFREKLIDIFGKTQSLADLSLENLETLSDEDFEFYTNHVNLLNEIISQAEDEKLTPIDYIKEQIKKLGNKKEKLTAKQLNEQLKDSYVRKMYRRALENEYYDSMIKLAALPQNYKRMIVPVDDGGLKDVADKLDILRGESELDENGKPKVKNRLLDRTYMSTLRHSFIAAKKWVGIAATNITALSIFQKSKIYIDPARANNLKQSEREILGDMRIALKHNSITINGKSYVSLSGSKTADGTGRYISTRLSGYATSFVDVAKDPFIMRIIKSELLVGTFMFLERVGAGELTPFFLNQPIITEYIKILESANKRWLFSKPFIELVRERFPASDTKMAETTLNVGIDALKENISNYYRDNKFTEIDNAQQNLILDEFLKYAMMASHSFKMTQATNYDTSKMKNGDLLFRKQTRTANAKKNNIICCVDSILKSSHLGEQAMYIDKASAAAGEYLQLEKPEIREQTIDVILRSYAENDFLDEDSFSKIGMRVTASLIDYIIQTRTGINSEIKDIFIEQTTSAASLVKKAQEKNPDHPILKHLVIRPSKIEGGVDIVKLQANPKDFGLDENHFIGLMRQLRDDPETNNVYKALVKMSVLQGTHQTATSIKNIVPLEDYSNELKDRMVNIRYTPDMEVFVKDMFYRNQWKNEDVFKKVYPTFFPKKDQYGNFIEFFNPESQETEYIYNSPSFPNMKQLGVRNNTILILSDKYNGRDLGSDYVLVERLLRKPENRIKDKKYNPYVDIVTGQEYTEYEYKKFIAKGDPIATQVFGYKLVKHPDNTPVVIYDKEDEKKYVYKLINLYGEGDLLSEYYTDLRKSVVNNNTAKIDNEIEDTAVYNYADNVNEKNPKNIKADTTYDTMDLSVTQPPIDDTPFDTNEPASFTNHSGGASGSDALWDQIGRKYGVVNHRHYREPESKSVDSETLSKAGVKPVNISEEDYNEGIAKATNAMRMMFKDSQYKTARSPYIVRNWAQVKYADAIYAIGTIKQAGEKASDKKDDDRIAAIPIVKGGTGYAVQMAINERKPVYVFDGTKEGWYKYDYNVKNFVSTEIPTLTKNFAGIGSRSLSSQEVWNSSMAAIEDVYKKTFDVSPTSTASVRKTYSGKVTSLEPNQIFVFGSNEGSSKGAAPTHGAGSAKIARDNFGAIQGQSRGLQGQSYGIVTKKFYDVEKSSTPQEIVEEIKGLYEYAKQNPTKEFLVSDYSKSNLNGYTGQQMADMFNSAGPIPSNIVFNKNFDKLVGTTQAPVTEPTSEELLNDKYQYYGAPYTIVVENGVGVDVVGYRGKPADKQKLLNAYNTNPNVDPQNGKSFRKETEQPKFEQLDTEEPNVSDETNTFTFSDGTVINTGKIKLNSQQEEALQLAVNAIKRKQTKFVLRGFAGTGKSTISKFIREYTQQNKSFKSVTYSSPTHKANTNLLLQLIRGKIFNISPSTTAAILNKKKENGMWIPGPRNKMPSNGVLIVDESSMINDEDYTLLINLAKLKGSTIIFMGDSAQLPPVSSNQISKAMQFDSSDQGIELTQVMRQQGDNPLLDVLTNIRENLKSKADKFSFVSKVNSKGEGISFTKNYENFNKNIKDYFSSKEYKEDPTYAKILTYTNSSVSNYNNMIQNLLNLEPYSPNSIMMGYEQVGTNSFINNGQDYVILESEYVSNKPVKVFKGNIGNRKFDVNSEISGYEVKLRQVFSKEDEKLLLENGRMEIIVPIEIFIINPIDDNNISFMQKVLSLKQLLNDFTIPWSAKESAVNQFDDFFSKYQFPADIINYKGVITTLQKLKEDNPKLFKKDPETGVSEFEQTDLSQKTLLPKNIDYGYAVTSHKGQGSTYKYIFVDLENMDNPANLKIIKDKGEDFAIERQQLKYVGLSRASVEAFVYTRKTNELTLEKGTSVEIFTFDSLVEFTLERKQEILSNFVAKHKMTEEAAKAYINDALAKDRNNVLKILKECY
jgi:exodeoxyribonuclease-5